MSSPMIRQFLPCLAASMLVSLTVGGITASGEVYCWGGNSEGQLGDGTFGARKFRLTPHPVRGGLRFARIAGLNVSGHTCAVTPGNRAYCWGNNAYGQVGDGTRARRLRPVAVVGP